MTAQESLTQLASHFAEAILEQKEFRGETSFKIAPKHLREVAFYCRDELQFDMLMDVTSIDHLGEDPRFEIVYELYSLTHNYYVRLKTQVGEEDPNLPTISDIWPTANWQEREVYDMMGITFTDHPDLRRILMWEGYPYFPLRKDFPLEGKPTDIPEVAFSSAAPLQGGPFASHPSSGITQEREPRPRPVEEQASSGLLLENIS